MMTGTAALAGNMLMQNTLDDLDRKKKEAEKATSSSSDGTVADLSNIQLGTQGSGSADRDLAKMTQLEYSNYIKNYRPIEDQLIKKAQTDDSLIRQAVQDAQTATPLMQGIADRQASRYGANLTAVQQQQQTLGLERGNLLGGIQGIRDARVAQKDQNRALMGDLINIGQGVNRSALSQMSTAAKNQVDRDNANSAMRAQRRAQNMQMMGTAAIALMFM